MEVGSGSYWKLKVENGSWKWKLLEVEVGSGSYWKLKVENGSWKWKLLEVEVGSGSCVIDYSELVIDYQYLKIQISNVKRHNSSEVTV